MKSGKEAIGTNEKSYIDDLLNSRIDVLDPWVVAEATWAIEKLSAANLAESYHKKQLSDLIARLLATGQRCHNNHIEKLQRAILLLEGTLELPKDLIEQVLKEEQLEYTDQQIETILRDLRESVHGGEANLEVLYQGFRNKVRALCNQLELTQCYLDIKELLDQESADKIFSQWSVIGDDVRKNRRIFSKRDRSRLFEKFVEPIRSKIVSSKLSKLKKELRTGELPANPFLVHHRYGKLLSMLNDGQRAQVMVLINRELVIKQLKRQQVYKISPLENIVYNMLKINTKSLRSAKLLDENIAQFLYRFLNDEDISEQTYEMLKQRLRLVQMKIRYLSVGGNPEAVELVCLLSDCLTEKHEAIEKFWQNEFEKGMELIKRENPVIAQYPMFRRLIERDFNTLLHSRSKEFMTHFMKQHRAALREFADPEKHNRESMQQDLQLFLSQQLTQDEIQKSYEQLFNYAQASIEPAIKVYQKYQQHFKKEFIQGLNDQQEDLNSGVCLAMSSRLAKQCEMQPTMQLIELFSELKILPVDRYHQASYKTKRNFDSNTNNSAFFPEAIANKPGGVGVYAQLHQLHSSTQLQQLNIEKLTEQLSVTNGVCLVNFETSSGFAHSTLIVIDREQGRFGFFDCNLGLFDFSGIKDDPEIAAQLVLECVQDVFDFYGQMKVIELCQHQSEPRPSQQIRKD